ncbi:uncharacterized protein LOC119320078 [Triticum dicoccoides]|uniref:uncharacterized protein LOC119320078 n=1 Tax=Triticum dicoccoides TaxID=85692 RepID=UPI001891262F|nr:uncharacterized protein LOC119320078 [Triticum dicoccoides]
MADSAPSLVPRGRLLHAGRRLAHTSSPSPLYAASPSPPGPGPGIKKQTKAGARSTSQLLLYFLLTTSAEIGAPRASRQRSRFTEGCFFSPAATRAGEASSHQQQHEQGSSSLHRSRPAGSLRTSFRSRPPESSSSRRSRRRRAQVLDGGKG